MTNKSSRKTNKSKLATSADSLIKEPVSQALIDALRGCVKGNTSLVEAGEREHRADDEASAMKFAMITGNRQTSS